LTGTAATKTRQKLIYSSRLLTPWNNGASMPLSPLYRLATF